MTHTITQQYRMQILYAEFHRNETRHVENTGNNSFMPAGKLYFMLHHLGLVLAILFRNPTHPGPPLHCPVLISFLGSPLPFKAAEISGLQHPKNPGCCLADLPASRMPAKEAVSLGTYLRPFV
jgi:hypothetical protein